MQAGQHVLAPGIGFHVAARGGVDRDHGRQLGCFTGQADAGQDDLEVAGPDLPLLVKVPDRHRVDSFQVRET
jgi:hypothetical protein